MLCNRAQLGAGEQGDEARVQSALEGKIGKDGGKERLQVVRLGFREIDRSKPVQDGRLPKFVERLRSWRPEDVEQPADPEGNRIPIWAPSFGLGDLLCPAKGTSL
jgi:hypothetical protein